MGPWDGRWIRVLIKLGLRPDLHIVNDQVIPKPTLDVLCFDCGGMYKVFYGVSNPTSKCPKCDGK